MSSELDIYDQDLNNGWISVDEKVFRDTTRTEVGLMHLLGDYRGFLWPLNKDIIYIYLRPGNFKLMEKLYSYYRDYHDSLWEVEFNVSEIWGNKIWFADTDIKELCSFHSEDILTRFKLMEL